MIIKHEKKPFRFNNCWTDLQGYQDTVKQSWDSPARGKPMEILWQKLERLKPKLRHSAKSIANMQIKKL